MFVQIIRAKAGDPAGLKKVWEENKGRHGEGFLGATAGVTTKGLFVVAARFENEALAKKMSDSAEQSAMWAQIESCLDGPAEFLESSDVFMERPGSEKAGFVQMMRSKVSDRKRVEELEIQFDEQVSTLRPDLIGHMNVWLPDGRVHTVDWFTSEAEARAGEKKDMPADMQETFQEWMALSSDVEWFDITDPWYA